MSILKETRHPNILLLIGAYLTQDVLYMVSEMLAGDLWTALADPTREQELHWTARQGPMQSAAGQFWRTSCSSLHRHLLQIASHARSRLLWMCRGQSIALDISQGLCHLHQTCVLHLDVRPRPLVKLLLHACTDARAFVCLCIKR